MMNKYEEVARNLKSQGNNCSYSVYNAFINDFKLNGNYPEPRSIENKCGALLTALKILKEKGYEEELDRFENEFLNEFGYCKCFELMTHGGRCNDYVGWSANKLYEVLNI